MLLILDTLTLFTNPLMLRSRTRHVIRWYSDEDRSTTGVFRRAGGTYTDIDLPTLVPCLMHSLNAARPPRVSRRASMRLSLGYLLLVPSLPRCEPTPATRNRVFSDSASDGAPRAGTLCRGVKSSIQLNPDRESKHRLLPRNS
jgi:hypothetical protein